MLCEGTAVESEAINACMNHGLQTMQNTSNTQAQWYALLDKELQLRLFSKFMGSYDLYESQFTVSVGDT